MTRHASDVLRRDASSDAVNLAYNTWRQPSTDRTTLLIVEVYLEPATGEASARNNLEFDIDGDGVDELSFQYARADGEGPSNQTWAYIVPPGYHYQVKNEYDPSGNNSIQTIREYKV